MKSQRLRSLLAPLAALAAVAAGLLAPLPAEAQSITQPPVPAAACARELTANVVALDQVFYWNRLGAYEPQGQVYALERDVVNPSYNQNTCTGPAPSAGNAVLRRDKRPRPIVLRMNVGDCLTIRFRNWLAPQKVDEEQLATRAASIHVTGMQYVTSITDGGINIGQNPAGGVVAPGGQAFYKIYAQAEGTYLMYSGGALVGGGGEGGTIGAGLFGAINVQPKGAEYYRSQVTQADLQAARVISPSAFPIIDYDRRYSSSAAPYCGAANQPILRMLDPLTNEVVHSDLTAIITGPGRGSFPAPSSSADPLGQTFGGSPFFPANNILLNREKPYREFTIIFHDEINAVQAFPHFNDEQLAHTLHGVRDAFAINYGTGGAGAEVIANRLGVGPMANCVDCMYEEFFLTSWAVGDPAMVVDVPANFPCTTCDLKDGVNCAPQKGYKATRAYYPDDPSNVYHSYLNDHVKFRNLHAGIEDHHIFHLHAHQWLTTNQSDQSAYKDSQSIGQGAAWTYEIAYGGSGNRNNTAGDSIFHCHFYPHFAQGMWGMWRVHDVLELGTTLDATGRPVTLSDSVGNITTITRALPDAEIKSGTPIPALVPIPGQAMAPIPGPVQLVNGQINNLAGANPGYPFFVPGVAGARPPHPPMDTIWDGGLPRHVIVAGSAKSEENRLSFEKLLKTAQPLWVPENGTPTEITAMNFHAAGQHATQTPSGAAATFVVNHHTPVRGAPFADPCDPANDIATEAARTPTGNRPPDRTYKGANIQMDVVFNKAGWHYPQQRMITLWEDVMPTLLAQRPPEPFFFRANEGECVEYQHTNLTTAHWEVDDFQVRTPTDIIGQHIHLVKFDVMASDGGGNGFNYEDGTFSGEEVQHRIDAIRAWNGCAPGAASAPGDPAPVCPTAKIHPFFTNQTINANCDDHPDWLGAQTTVQRWWADPVKDNTGVSRTLRTVFTHDHFGPSTHQQAGLYAGLIIEKPNSTWWQNEGPAQLGVGRTDGGPTSWQARIRNGTDEFREFGLEFADFQLAYNPDGKFASKPAGQLQLICPDPDHHKGYADPKYAINPPARKETGPHPLYEKIAVCPIKECDPDGPYPGTTILGDTGAAPCPESVSAADPGFGVVNYRSEPLGLRVLDPISWTQAGGIQGDLSYAYETMNNRANPLLNSTSSPYIPYPPLTGGLFDGDPFTPLMRAYEEDQIKVRVLVGAHEEEHNFTFNANKWLKEPDFSDSGWRGSQHMGISEWYDLDIKRVPALNGTTRRAADFLYKPSASVQFQWDGIWGLLRLYRGVSGELPALVNNTDGSGLDSTLDAALFSTKPVTAPSAPVPDSTYLSTSSSNKASITPAPLPPTTLPTSCPSGVPIRTYDISAIAAQLSLPGNTLTYNNRTNSVVFLPPIKDPNDPCPDHGICPDVPQPDVTPLPEAGPLHDTTALMFVRTADLDFSTGVPLLRNTINPEPLVLRAIAGECIQVTLTNRIPPTYADVDGYSGVHMVIDGFNANDVKPSLSVGLHPELVSYDVLQSDGMNVGINRAVTGLTQTVQPGQSITYYWFAGHLFKNKLGTISQQPVEYGTVPLVSSDPIKHGVKGAVGALIIEPPGATWAEHQINRFNDPSYRPVKTYASATVTTPGSGSFLEYVAVFQTDVNLQYASGRPVPNQAVVQDATESGHRAVNYRTEPVWFRKGYSPMTPPERTRDEPDFDQVFLNAFTATEPVTPLFTARRLDRMRFRVLEPTGNTQNQVWELQGHIWQEEPYVTNAMASQYIGYNAKSNWMGTVSGIGTGFHFDSVVGAAGGLFGILGDYMYRSYVGWATDDGLWGILRVNTTGPTLYPTIGGGSTTSTESAGGL